MEKTPVYRITGDPEPWLARRRARRHRPWPILLLALLTFFVLGTHIHLTHSGARRAVRIPANAANIQARCQNLKLKPSPPPTFNNRTTSDRFAFGTKPTLIKNATIWTGRVNGLEIVKGDILLDKGLIKAVGHAGGEYLDSFDEELLVVDAKGAWVSPGCVPCIHIASRQLIVLPSIIDLHSHLGVSPSPDLDGSRDSGSLKGVVLPWLRALDGLNTHDDSYHLSIAGGVTTSLVLPGSGNGIGVLNSTV